MGVRGGQEQRSEVLENPENKGEERGGPDGDRGMAVKVKPLWSLEPCSTSAISYLSGPAPVASPL